MSSNVGLGLVSAEDTKKAANDAMAVSTGNFKFVSDVALGNIVLKNEMDHITDLQDRAIDTLGYGKFPVKEARKVLSEVAKKFPKLKNAVAEAVSYRLDQLKLLSKLALKEDAKDLGFDNNDEGLKLLLQIGAIRRLGSGIAPIKESLKVLQLVKNKFPELKEDVEKALARLEIEETNRQNGTDLESLFPDIIE